MNISDVNGDEHKFVYFVLMSRFIQTTILEKKLKLLVYLYLLVYTKKFKYSAKSEFYYRQTMDAFVQVS